MSSIREEPFFNLKAVVKQTGLKPDTLRAWERRYGLPSPERSAGGHRRYSQYDISMIKWLSARQREGLSISRAVELWRQLEAEGRDPLRTPMPLATQPAPPATSYATERTIDGLCQQWTDACLAYDEQTAEMILAQAFALYPPEIVCLDLLRRAMAEMGEAWYKGEITVQQEHFCSALAIRRVEALIMAAPPPTRPSRILAACSPDEQHVFGLLVLTYLLRRRGWDVVYLGANVPIERLASTIDMTEPRLVILAAQQLHTAASLLQAAQVVQHNKVSAAYGGLIFNLLPALRERIPGHFLGEHLESASRVAESLMTAPRPLPTVAGVPEGYQQARDHFSARRDLIEAQATQALPPSTLAPSHLTTANQEFALNIDAALALGNLNYLDTHIEWVEGLIKNYEVPSEALHRFFRAYYEAAKQQLDERGELVVAWLRQLVDKSEAN